MAKEVGEGKRKPVCLIAPPHILAPDPPSAWVPYLHCPFPSLPYSHLFVRVQVQKVGGIQTPVHTLLVPGQPAAHCPALGGGLKHELPGLAHFHRWGRGPLLLLGGGRGHVSPRAPAPLPSACPQCWDTGRASSTTHHFLCGERTKGPAGVWRPLIFASSSAGCVRRLWEACT